MFYRTSDELLPTVTSRDPGGEQFHLTEVVVRGSVAEVEQGEAFDEGDGGQEEVPFDSKDADRRTLHLQVDVDEQIAGAKVERVRVGLAIDGRDDADAVAAGLEAMDDVLLFLQRGSAVFSYDAALLSVVDDGLLFATVAKGEVVRLPMLDRDHAERVLGDVRTMQDVRDAARAEPRTIELSRSEGVLLRPA